ncbi:hypothetical protein F5Y16DRAFT_371210 [Xylariaceae sp. FL0255]|nr:hypothetical protein F5Y16DRAFT_371210 [Xylariaceae sp. FL0255]
MPSSSLFFRIAYNAVYFLLCLILTALLLVVPGDFIVQALQTTHQIINLVIIAIVYVLAIVIVLFVYALRLYLTRSALAAIPRAWIPIEKGDLKGRRKDVYLMIEQGLSRSAAIAWEARPKVIPQQDVLDGDDEGTVANGGNEEEKGIRKSLQLFRSRQPATVEDEMGIALPSVQPVWGEVEHHGWGSPASPDLPNLQYSTVLLELPNLIEAKAVSQAPADPDSDPLAEAPTLDADAVALLQRAPNMTMRQYIQHLTELDVLDRDSRDLAEFVDLYERVRFCGRPMSNETFRRLMRLFAEILRNVRPLSPDVLYEALGLEGEPGRFDGGADDGARHGDGDGDGDIDDDAPQDYSAPTTPARSVTSSGSSLRSVDSDSASDSQSQRRQRQRQITYLDTSPIAARDSSAHTRHQYRTAPTTPSVLLSQHQTQTQIGGTATRPHAHRSPSANSGNSANSFAQSRQPYYPASMASSSSLKSSLKSSSGSESQGSVIRLATAAESDAGSLPYVLQSFSA